jgi:hypothetical protein
MSMFLTVADLNVALVKWHEERYAELEKAHNRVVNSHVYIDSDEFAALSAMAMCNDDVCAEWDQEKVSSVLDQIAVNCLGFSDWTQAYHEIK